MTTYDDIKRDSLFSLLQTNKHLRVVFNKVDGTERIMNCTLHPDVLPPQEPKETVTERKDPTTAIAVWDIDANGWRSFRLDSIIAVSIETEDADANS